VPELIEVESYRRTAEQVVGRTVEQVTAPDDWFIKRGASAGALAGALLGERVLAATRLGKLLMLPMSSGAVLGLRFGMTGRLVVDGALPIERLEYSSGRVDAAWERFGLGFVGGGSLSIIDPRRLGGVELDPDLDALGPEASTVTVAQLRGALGRSTAPLKAALLDQHRLAGLGNLLVDETLWRVGLDPARPAGSLDPDEQRRLAAGIRSTVRTLDRRGGSHTGDLQHARARGAVCPRCGAPLLRRTIGGRTTYSCPVEQAGP
jgi:formamidopyrimidine-DNA glycosylase